MTEGKETYKETVQEYTEPDGTRVIKKTITQRVNKQQHKQVKENTNEKNLMTQDAPSSDETSLSPFEQAFLDRHNELRAKHDAPPLIFSRELCDYAQEWVNNIAARNIIQHRPNNKFGENIYYKTSTSLRLRGEEVVNNWYEEAALYTYYGGEPPRDKFSDYGHFTQLVWKDCKKIGVAFALNGKKYFVVANYDPHGNIITRFEQNVLPPKD